MDHVTYADRIRDAAKKALTEFKYHLVGEGPDGWSVMAFNDESDKKKYAVREESGRFKFDLAK